jgi:hypothetical protein
MFTLYSSMYMWNYPSLQRSISETNVYQIAFIKANIVSKFAYSSHSHIGSHAWHPPGYVNLDTEPARIGLVSPILPSVYLIIVLSLFWLLRVSDMENGVSIGLQKWTAFWGRALQFCALLLQWLTIPVSSLHLDLGTI